MYLAPDDDEAAVGAGAAEFLSSAMPRARLHAAGVVADMDAGLRALLGKMGWFGLAVSAADGGSGLGAVEHTLFFREVGRQCGPVDILAQCLAAGLPIDPGLRAALLAGGAGVALLVPDGGNGWRQLGALDASHAIEVTAEGAKLFARGAIAADLCPALDPANSLARAVRVGEPLVQVSGAGAWRLGALGIAAMLVGIAEAALDLTVEYAKVRETFGRKIGSWQAVRHPCADMAMRGEAARAQLWYAAAAIAGRRGDADAHLDAARHLAAEAALAAADTAIQLHGGIGVTDEHDCHLLLKHALLLGRVFGTRRALLGRLLNARLED